MGSPEHQPIDEHAQQISKHGGKAPKLEKYFQALVQAEASDLHLKADAVPHIRVQARIRPTQGKPLSAEEVAEMADELMTEKQRAFFAEHGSIDLAHELEGSDRFRVNIYRQRGSVAIAVRRVTREIPDFETLHLPPIVEKIAGEHHGLILLSGPTGCGKSTTIASMLQHINRTRPCHILTIEDPIEYLFKGDKALINQREIGIDVESFPSALKYLPREDPDIVLIGEMRDQETFQSALQVAETGHLIFGTIHASSASQTVGRILDLFPPDGRDIVRQALAFNLRAIVCQILLPSIAEDIDRIPTVEILLMNPSVRQLITEGRDSELPDVIRSHERAGMQSVTKSLLELIEKDYITPQVAYEAAPNVDELKMLLKGITTSQSGLLGG